MQTSSIPDAKYQELNMSFDFKEHEDKLTITAQVENTSYQAELMFNPDVQFQDVKDAFLNKHFKLVSKTPQILKLRVGFLNLQFKNMEKMTLNELKETINQLKTKLEKQAEKNYSIEKSNQQLRADVDSIMTKMADLSLKLESVQSQNDYLRKRLIESNQRIDQSLMIGENQKHQLNAVKQKLVKVEKNNNKMKNIVDDQKAEIQKCRRQIEKAFRSAEIHQMKSKEKNHSKEISFLEKTIVNNQTVKKNDLNKQRKKQRYVFDEKFKVENIHLSQKNTKAKQTISKFQNSDLGNIVLVDRLVSKKGSSIRFKIEQKTWQVAVGLGIRRIIVKNDYKGSRSSTGHGYFLISSGGMGFSHSHPELNRANTRFTYSVGDTVKIETNETELIFTNQTKQSKAYKMPISLTEEEWKEASFCVELNTDGECVSII